MKRVKKIGESGTALVIAGVSIYRDEYGRYNLNVLHEISEYGTDRAKAPARWTRLKSTKELVEELQDQEPNMALETVHGGDRAGTYAHELLVVSYAGWISPAFQLKVNKAFLDMKRGESFHQTETLPMSPAQFLLRTAQELVAHEEEIVQLKVAKEEHADRLETLEARRPPEGKQTIWDWLWQRGHQPPRADFRKLMRAFAVKCETPEPYTAEGHKHPWEYFLPATLETAYLEASKQLTFLHDPSVPYRTTKKRKRG